MPLRIPIPVLVTSTLVVYYPARPTTHGIPPDLVRSDSGWLDEHVPDPLRSAIVMHREQRLLDVRRLPPASLPQLPSISLLRYMGLGELEERILAASTEAALLSAVDLNTDPRTGLWSVTAAAFEVAQALGGVIFDPEALRIVKLPPVDGLFTPRGGIAASRHIVVPISVGESGLGWLTTRGLGKFGLPDIEVRDLPANHLSPFVRVANATAQHLIEEVSRVISAQVERSAESTDLTIEATLAINHDLMGRAVGLEFDSAGAREIVDVGLVFDERDQRSGRMPMIRIVPPGDVTTEMGVWTADVLDRLVGSWDEPHLARTSSDAMQQAHRRAMREIADVKTRFLSGLAPGHILFHKRGFATPDGGAEYMWIAVSEWSEKSVTGTLASHPRLVANVRTGERVVFPESEIFDWMIELSNGRHEGGYTSEVVSKEGE
jgi:uncharacterized protein YegJ (DUF2314 family)